MCIPASHCSLENLLSQIPFKLHPQSILFTFLYYQRKSPYLLLQAGCFHSCYISISFFIYRRLFAIKSSVFQLFLTTESPSSEYKHILHTGRKKQYLPDISRTSRVWKIHSFQVHMDHSPEKPFDESQRKKLLR